uniref:Uncharacterized protein n=1 Tax=Cafeteria roenbergensis TaxID=33653 RepID=A0A7S0JYT0_CAFRO|mmetsp:Transcript_22344/g.84772  ORF Transcript_22344/g.84772 Transcript_22344/m.84772 type:complete len:646 (+) Transcript_22344:99-2036(+)
MATASPGQTGSATNRSFAGEVKPPKAPTKQYSAVRELLMMSDPVVAAAAFPASHCLETFARVLLGRKSSRDRSSSHTRPGEDTIDPPRPARVGAPGAVPVAVVSRAAGRADPAVAMAGAAAASLAAQPATAAPGAAAPQLANPLMQWMMSMVVGPAATGATPWPEGGQGSSALRVRFAPGTAGAGSRGLRGADQAEDDADEGAGEEVTARRPLLGGGASDRDYTDGVDVLRDGIDTLLDAELHAAERGERRLSAMQGGFASSLDGDDMVALGAFEGDSDILGAEVMRGYFEPEATAGDDATAAGDAVAAAPTAATAPTAVLAPTAAAAPAEALLAEQSLPGWQAPRSRFAGLPRLASGGQDRAAEAMPALPPSPSGSDATTSSLTTAHVAAALMGGLGAGAGQLGGASRSTSPSGGHQRAAAEPAHEQEQEQDLEGFDDADQGQEGTPTSPTSPASSLDGGDDGEAAAEAAAAGADQPVQEQGGLREQPQPQSRLDEEAEAEAEEEDPPSTPVRGGAASAAAPRTPHSRPLSKHASASGAKGGAGASPAADPAAAPATPGLGSPLSVGAALQGLDAALMSAERGGLRAGAARRAAQLGASNASFSAPDDGHNDDEDEELDASMASSVARELAGEGEPTAAATDEA